MSARRAHPMATDSDLRRLSMTPESRTRWSATERHAPSPVVKALAPPAVASASHPAVSGRRDPRVHRPLWRSEARVSAADRRRGRHRAQRPCMAIPFSICKGGVRTVRSTSVRCTWLVIVSDVVSKAAPAQITSEAISAKYRGPFDRVYWLMPNIPEAISLHLEDAA